MKHLTIFLSAILSLAAITASAENQYEWDPVSPGYFKWGPNASVNIYSSSTSKLSFWNYHAPSKQDEKNNRWTSQNITMPISWTSTKPWRITFQIKNNNDRHDYTYKVYNEKGKETWYNGNVYWGFIINARKYTSGSTEQ